MYKGNTIGVSVRCHNESALIGKVITTMPEFVDHIVIVDDASTDGTADAVRAVADPRVDLIVHETNKGAGEAAVTAHKRNLELGVDIVVNMDGDGQMDPAYLPDLLDPIVEHGVGFAKANRFFSIDSFRGMPRYRVFGNIVLSFLTKVASGYWNLFDPQNGYTALRREALERVDLDTIAKSYEFENDLLIRLNILDVTARDVDVPAVYGDEVSGIRLHKVIPQISWMLFRGFFRRMLLKYVIRSFSPVALFFFTGLFLLLVSFGFGTYAVVTTLGPPTASAGTVLLAVVPFILAVQFLLFATTLDIQNSPDQPPRRTF